MYNGKGDISNLQIFLASKGGKSAILAGLTVALGAKANVTIAQAVWVH